MCSFCVASMPENIGQQHVGNTLANKLNENGAYLREPQKDLCWGYWLAWFKSVTGPLNFANNTNVLANKWKYNAPIHETHWQAQIDGVGLFLCNLC